MIHLTETDFSSPEYFNNRELSLLQFQHRVIAQAKSPDVPLLERLKFLCISTSNLDEFFAIRVAGLKQMIEVRSSMSGPDGMAPDQVLQSVSDRARELIADQYQVLNEELRPALATEDIRFLIKEDWSEEQARWLEAYFHDEVLPVLSPLGLDPARPFPRIINMSLNFIVKLKGKDAFGRKTNLAVVQAPRSLPRVIQLPADICAGSTSHFALLSTIIQSFSDSLFAGLKVLGCYQFRVTRNSDLFVDDEEVDDLLRALEGQLASRRYGAAVRLEVGRTCPDELADFLLDHFSLEPSDLYRVDGPVNLSRLMALYDLVGRNDLKYPQFKPGLPPELAAARSFFHAIRTRDILLMHPYQSFSPIIDLIHNAAADPKVLAIKQTLYRTGPESPVVGGLVAAARAGKEVTVIIELRARFDEEANIALATRLHEAGAHVMYGVAGFKTHAKMLLIVRRESTGLRRYVHLGTGNYHLRTSRIYTDYGLLTCNPEIGEDVHEMFIQLTSPTKPATLHRLVSSPFSTHQALIDLVEFETTQAAEGKPARIVAKMNSLVEPLIISALYRASAAGVDIDLIVRGICCLRPGVPGVSENIRVVSIVGRFLEHSRVFQFHHGGDTKVLIASADWMDRNFFRRVEVCCPIEKSKLRKRLSSDLEIYLADNTNAWEAQADGSYRRLSAEGGEIVCAQETFLETLADN